MSQSSSKRNEGRVKRTYSSRGCRGSRVLFQLGGWGLDHKVIISTFYMLNGALSGRGGGPGQTQSRSLAFCDDGAFFRDCRRGGGYRGVNGKKGIFIVRFRWWRRSLLGRLTSHRGWGTFPSSCPPSEPLLNGLSRARVRRHAWKENEGGRGGVGEEREVRKEGEAR